jgi:hypothetical protein
MDYALNGSGSIPGTARLFSLPQFESRLLGPNQPPIHWVPEALSQRGVGGISRGVKFTNYLHLLLSSKKTELYLHRPINLHGILLN